jgi:TatD DNase family protein
VIDTHCHLTSKHLWPRVDQVIADAEQAGVDRMISVGITPGDSRRAATLATERSNIFSSVGGHPLHALECVDHEELQSVFRELAPLPQVVALGEMGLDKHYDEPPLEDQRRLFRWQLELICELDAAGSQAGGCKPIIIHNRKATDETLSMIRDSGIAGDRFVFHCFTGASAELDQILAIGAMISFTGITTFKNAKDIAACAGRMPMDRIMIETDSPYLTPDPHRKIFPNEPKFVKHVADCIAMQKDMSAQDFVAAVDGNAERFFGLPAN